MSILDVIKNDKRLQNVVFKPVEKRTLNYKPYDEVKAMLAAKQTPVSNPNKAPASFQFINPASVRMPVSPTLEKMQQELARIGREQKLVQAEMGSIYTGMAEPSAIAQKQASVQNRLRELELERRRILNPYNSNNTKAIDDTINGIHADLSRNPGIDPSDRSQEVARLEAQKKDITDISQINRNKVNGINAEINRLAQSMMVGQGLDPSHQSNVMAKIRELEKQKKDITDPFSMYLQKASDAVSGFGYNFIGAGLNAVDTATKAVTAPIAKAFGHEPQDRTALTQNIELMYGNAERARANAKKGLNFAQQALVDAIDTTGTMGLSIGASAMTGGVISPLAVMSVTSGGDAAKQAKDKGASLTQQTLSGMTNGAITYLTSKLPFERLVSIFRNPASATAKKIIGDILIQTGSEATEESIEALAQGVANKLIYDKDAPWADWNEIGYSALMGGAMGGAGAAGAHGLRGITRTKAEGLPAQNIPENIGPININNLVNGANKPLNNEGAAKSIPTGVSVQQNSLQPGVTVNIPKKGISIGDSQARLVTTDAGRLADFEMYERNNLVKQGYDPGDTPLFSEIHQKSYTPDMRRAVKFANILGVEAVVYSPNSDYGNTKNGSYFNNKIYLNSKSDNNLLAVAGHEASHRLKTQYPDMWGKVIEALKMKTVANDPDFLRYKNEKMERYQADNPEFTEADFWEEYAGDITGDAILKPENLEKIIQTSPDTGNKILDFVRGMIDRVRAFFKTEKPRVGIENSSAGYVHELQKVERQIVKTMQRAVRETGPGVRLGTMNVNTGVKKGLTYGLGASMAQNGIAQVKRSGQNGTPLEGHPIVSPTPDTSLAYTKTGVHPGGEDIKFSINQNSGADNIGTFDGIDQDIRFSIEAEKDAFSVPQTVLDGFSKQLGGWETANSQLQILLKSSSRTPQITAKIQELRGVLGKPLSLGNTSLVLQKLGADSLPMVITSSVVDKVTGGTDFAHTLSLDELKKLPSELANPIMVFDSETDKGTTKNNVPRSLVVLTTLTSENGHEVVAAVHLNKRQDFTEINDVASLYSKTDETTGKNRIADFINAQIDAENLRYIDKNKSDEWLRSRRLQLPRLNTILASNNNILQKKDIVNTIVSENQKNMIGSLDNGRDLRSDYNDRNNPDIKSSLKTANPLEGKTVNTKSKADIYRAQQEMDFMTRVADIFSIPKTAKRGRPINAAINEFKPLLKMMADEVRENGFIHKETMRGVFDYAYEAGRIVDDEYYNHYKDLRDSIRNEKLLITDDIKQNIPDFGEYRKKNIGTLRLTSGEGTPVDVKYQELSNHYPELFPAEFTHPADQLQQIEHVVNNITATEYNLDEYYGSSADSFKKQAYGKFLKAANELVNEYKIVERHKADLVKPEKPMVNMTADEVLQNYQQIERLRREKDKVVFKHLLTDKDRVQVDRLLKGEIAFNELPRDVNARAIKEVYDASKPIEDMMAPLRQYKEQKRQQNLKASEQLLAGSDSWKDKKFGKLYARETMERNIRDIATTPQEAERIVDYLFTPVHKSEAQANVFKNRIRERVRNLKLNEAESRITQVVGELQAEIDTLESNKNGKQGNASRIAELKKLQQDEFKGLNIDVAKIKHAVTEFRAIYDELFTMVNKVLVANGYEPVPYRKGYFPHFMEEITDSKLAKIAAAVGMKLNKLNAKLPTDIAGMTHIFRPGKKWVGNFLERKGGNTVYDAVKGFDNYIEGVADVIFHTENIQRLRAFEDSIRHKYSDKGITEAIESIRNDNNMAEEEKEGRLRELYERDTTKLPNFVREVRTYTDLLAGKKHIGDRQFEHDWGRGIYTIMKSTESRIAANMVGLNISSALTNFTPLVQGFASLNSVSFARGMYDTLHSFVRDDGLTDKSAFLINRRGSDRVHMTGIENFAKKAGVMFEGIDQFATQSLVRSRYYDNMRKGMSSDAAMTEADKWAAGVVGDRSKGSMPTLFEMKNPIAKILTMFQLESNNQLSHLLKDIPRDKKEGGIKAIALALVKYIGAAWAFDEIYEKVTGRRVALDIADYFLTAYEDFTDPEKTVWDAIESTFMNITEDMPFVGGFLGGGRFPVSQGLPDIPKTGEAISGFFSGEMPKKKAGYTLFKELSKPALYTLPPFGGGQVRKTAEGIATLAAGGSYTINGKGEEELQFPTKDKNGFEMLQAALFGKYALPEGRKWVESGFKNLSAENTAFYKKADIPYKELEGYLKAIKPMKSLKNEKGTDIQHSVMAQKAKHIMAMPIGDDKKALLLQKENIKTSPDELKRSNTVEQYIKAIGAKHQKEAAKKAKK